MAAAVVVVAVMTVAAAIKVSKSLGTFFAILAAKS
jgi:hypothetical protein